MIHHSLASEGTVLAGYAQILTFVVGFRQVDLGARSMYPFPRDKARQLGLEVQPATDCHNQNSLTLYIARNDMIYDLKL